ncbi:putative ankyrin repeat protein RF_0381 [Leptopilina boulardi]|uniref:putative ankyrin repeat protein RF_0381 n=1 Tax=Leptopilina boulardi TaxID=63433 RepID=UPI0021F610B8|nr:putative ankyrin repeat protein RF_0381 [Leptopilina boulardi]
MMNTRSKNKRSQSVTLEKEVPAKKPKNKKLQLDDAIKTGNLELVKLFYKNMTIEVKRENNQQHLNSAVENNHIEVVKYLLDNDFKKELSIQENHILIRKCILNNRLDIAKCFIDNDVGINEQNAETETLLHYSAKYGRLNILKYLIECGAEINIRTDFNETPLHYAIKAEQVEIVKELLSLKGKETNYDFVFQNLAVHTAAQNGNEEIFHMLIEARYPLNDCLKEKHPIHVAAEFGHWKLIKILIKAGVDINTKSKDNNTPLYFAAVSGKSIVVEFLLDAGSKLSKSYNEQIPEIIVSVLNRRERMKSLKVEYFVKILRSLINYIPDDKFDEQIFSSINYAFPYKAPVKLLDVLFEYDISNFSVSHEWYRSNSKLFIALIDHVDNFATLIGTLNYVTVLDTEHARFIKSKDIESIVARIALLQLTYENTNFDGLFFLLFRNMLEKHYSACNKKLKIMQSLKIIEGINVTYYDILSKPIDKVANYFKHEKLMLTLESSFKMFTEYISLFEQRIKIVKERKELFKAAALNLFNLVNDIHKIQLPSLVIENILKFLSVINLRRLLSVCSLIDLK